ncbi:MAG TPA: PKD domain-containing protein, partial [Candidatus Acidoferrales bacterium]|nr:PKD domain-containing protein [Candidatus Acidoferrales bacterium]
LTFSWSFGGTLATGGTVNQTFAQSGDVTVTLTVTDSQGNTAQKTQTISVASSDLVGRINDAAGQSESMLDDILANATSSAGAADYFANDVEEAPNEIAVKGAFAEVGLILNVADGEDTTKLAQDAIDWTRKTYGNAAADILTAKFTAHYLSEATVDAVRDDFEQSVALWAINNGKVNLSYQQMWIPNLTTLVSQQKAYIEQLRQQAVTAAGSINSTQSAQLVQDLQARLLGNYALQASYDQNAALPIQFQQYKSSDENDWTTFSIGQRLFTVSSGLLDTALGGVGGIVATAAFSATQAEQDIFNTLASQSAEAQLMSASISMTGQGFVTVNQISTNIEVGLQDVIQTQPASPSSGQIVSITPYTQGTLRTYNLIPTWFASSAYANVVIKNSGTQTATYRLEAFLTKTFVTGQLPGGFLGIGQRQYEIPVATSEDGITLSAGAQQTVTLTYLTGDGGQVPEGQDITYTLTARAANGYYRQDQQNQQFGTIYLDENGNPIDPALVAAASKPQPPLQSSALLYPGTNMCAIQISLQNPFDAPTMVNLQQAIPAGAVIIDPAGGNYSSGQLTWSLNLQAGGFQYFQVVLQLTAPGSTITNTVASIYDNVNETWMDFTNTPAISQMVTAPAPDIQGTGFSSGAFGLNVQALIPGVYTIDGSTNLHDWTQISTVTNDAGSIQINDPDAQNHPSRFYRVFRQ